MSKSLRNRKSRILRMLRILTVIIVAIAIEIVSIKIVSTALSLIVLRDNASFYNEQMVKTNSMTDEYNANQEVRQSFYQSEDVIVRVYSNMNALFKILVALVAFYAMFAIPVTAIRVYIAYRKIQAKRRRRKKNLAV